MDDKDFDYDLFELKYGINLRTDSAEHIEEADDLDKNIDEPVIDINKAQEETTVKEEKEKRKEHESQAKMELYDWLQCIVSAILCGILLFVFVGRVIGVDGTSMLQTLQNDDKIIMSNLFYKPKFRDIVVIKTEAFGDTPLVKRVIATEGQTVDIDFENGVVFVDGILLDEPYTNTPTTDRENFEGPVTVPEGCVFVMGDNRNESTDSRSVHVGMVDTRNILGKVLFVLIPGINEDGTRSWGRIGSAYKYDSISG
jgi:signal peptidase I